MDAKKFLLGTLGGGVAYFLVGFVLYGLVMADFFAANAGTASGVTKEPPALWALAIGNLLHGALLTYIFGKWAGIRTFSGGLMGGAIVGLLMGGGMDFVMYGTSNLMNMTGLITDIVVFGLMSALAGGVVGWILGRGEQL